jgi:hypothetical protein
MGFLSIFKLEKFTVSAFTDNKRTKPASPPKFEAMFNPTTLERKYAIEYGPGVGSNASGKELRYSHSPPTEINVNLVLDGTGASEMGVTTFTSKSVEERVKNFLDVCYGYDGKIHQPHFLKAQWGILDEACRLVTADVTYTLFGRDGKPLRATIAAVFITAKEAYKREREENKESPDLTHSRIVRAGDTLPLLTEEIYGSGNHYLDVARFNDLDDFRRLAVGSEVSFPPLEQLGNS